jgi:hypothetical protein
VYVLFPSLADEADCCGSLNLFDVYVESCRSVSTLGVTELFAMKKKWSEITHGLRGKRPVTLNPKLPFKTDANFPQAFPKSCPTWYRVVFLSLWFPIQIIAS